MAANVTIKVESHAKEVINAKNQMVEKALEAMGLQCEKYAKMICPVDSGRLRNSITHDVRMDEEAVYVGTAVEYAPYVEYGHLQEVGRYVPALGKRLVAPKVDAKPFIKPAVEDHKEEYKAIAESCMKS